MAPALLTWRLTASNGERVAGRVVADFRHSEPPKRHFWDVYAAGTYQNFPVFNQHFYWRQPGRYLFQLTHHALETRRLPNGAYRLQIRATDLCGNRDTSTQPELVNNQSSTSRQNTLKPAPPVNIGSRQD